MSNPTPRVRALLPVVVALVVLGTASGALTQGRLKGTTLPIVSTSDVIGYVAPCG